MLRLLHVVVCAAVVTAAALAGAPRAAALNIPPTVRISDARTVESDGVRRVLAFDLLLSRVPATAVVVNFATRDGSARSSADYVPRSGMVTIPAGATRAALNVELRADDVPEYSYLSGINTFEDFTPEETMSVRLSTVTGARIFDGSGTGTIADDDRAFDSFAAGAAGHAWSNAYLLGLASHYVYKEELLDPRKTEADFRMAFETRFGKLGMSGFRFFRAPGSFEAYGMTNANAMVITFRGTKEPEDFLTDANLDQVPLTPPLFAHAGFAASLDGAYTQILEFARTRGTRRLWLTGHSLGGALATLAAWRLQQDGVTVQGVSTYGSPRVGNTAFALSYEALFASRPTQRWVNANDPIPLIPPPLIPRPFPLLPLDYAHVGDYNHIVEFPPLSGTFQVSLDLNALLELPPVPDVTIGDHNTRRYLNRILAAAPAATRARMPKAPPSN